MRVHIDITVEVDPEMWTMIYGDDHRDIRESVKRYCFGQISDSAAAAEDALHIVKIRA